MREPLVSFVGVNYRTPHLYRHVLSAVADARLPWPYDFFFVDNASGDVSVSVVREHFPWADIIASDRNRGLGGGINLALQKARGTYVCYLNPDLVIFPGELERWIAWMEAHSDVGISGPRIVNPDGTDQDSCYRFPKVFTPLLRRTFLGRLPCLRPVMDRYIMKDMDRSVTQDVDWVLGAALLIRRDLLARIGHFDERFFLYLEDTDLCRRAWAAGSRVTYASAATFVHYHQRQSQTRHVWQALTNPLTRTHIKSGVKYFLKYLGEPKPRRS